MFLAPPPAVAPGAPAAARRRSSTQVSSSPCSPPYTERNSHEHLPLLEQRALISEQEGEQERADVRAVHVRVGQDDDFGVAKLRLVKLASPLSPRPSAVTMLEISVFLYMDASSLRSTLRILPRSASTAWNRRSRPCLALPPAGRPRRGKSPWTRDPKLNSRTASREASAAEDGLATDELARARRRLCRLLCRGSLGEDAGEDAGVKLEVFGNLLADDPLPQPYAPRDYPGASSSTPRTRAGAPTPRSPRRDPRGCARRRGSSQRP